MEFNENMKIARNKAGLTQTFVAEKMGITKSTYCGYETGKRQPDVEKIKQISAILDVSADYLLGISSDEAEKDNKKALLASFEQLNEEGQEKVMEYIALLVSSGQYIH